jgi:hypothetical protein
MILIENIKQWDAHALMTGRAADLVEATAHSDFRRDQVSEEACTCMKRFDKAALYRRARLDHRVVRGPPAPGRPPRLSVRVSNYVQSHAGSIL